MVFKSSVKNELTENLARWREVRAKRTSVCLSVCTDDVWPRLLWFMDGQGLIIEILLGENL